jgi:hypothetical protein
MARTASLAGHPGDSFASAMNRFVALSIEDEIIADFSFEWSYGWVGELTPAASPADGRIRHVTYTYTAGALDGDEYISAFFFLLDIENNELSLAGAMGRDASLADGGSQPVYSDPYLIIGDELDEFLLEMVTDLYGD